jgi:hypothetical protein
MKIEDMISGKSDNEQIIIEGLKIPVSALKNFMKEGYEQLLPYREEKTLSIWGKTCTGCFTEQEIREKA